MLQTFGWQQYLLEKLEMTRWGKLSLKREKWKFQSSSNLWSRSHDRSESEGRLRHAVGHLHLVRHDLALGDRVVGARGPHHLHLHKHRLASLGAGDVWIWHRDRRHLETLLTS